MKDVESTFRPNQNFTALLYKETINSTTEVEAQCDKFVKDVGEDSPNLIYTFLRNILIRE